ncbi:MAG: putative RND superfamily exporter protein [Myxococcota bacterium]
MHQLILNTFLAWNLRKRRAARLIWALVTAASIGSLLVVGLHVDTGRQNIVDPPDPDAVRFLRFTEIFGSSLNVIALIEGPDPAANRTLANALAAELNARPDVFRDVLYRLRLEDMQAFAPLYASPATLDKAASLLEAAPEDAGSGVLELDGVASLLGHMVQAVEVLTEEGGAGLGGVSKDIESNPDPLGDALEQLFETLGDATTMPDWTPWRAINRAAPAGTELGGADDYGFISAKDGTQVFLFCQPASETGQADEIVAFVEGLREAANRLKPTDVEVLIAGYPVYIAAETRLIETDFPRTTTAAVLGVLALFLLAFRSWYGTFVVVVPLLAGISATLAFAAVVLGGINVFSLGTFAMVSGLGIDFSIHLAARYDEAARRGHNPGDAVEITLRKGGPGVVTGALSTVLVFVAITITEFTGMRQIGILASFGLLTVLLASLMLIPGLLAQRHESLVSRSRKWPAFSSGTGKLNAGSITTARPWVTLGVCALATAVLMPSIEPVEFTFKTSDFLPEGSDGRVALEKIRDSGTLSPDFAVSIAESLAQAREMTDAFNARPDVVVRAESVATWLPRTEDGHAAALARLREARMRLPGLKLGQPKSPEGRGAAYLKQLKELVDVLENDLPFTLQQLGRKSLLAVVARGAVAARKALDRASSAPPEVVDAAVLKLDRQILSLVGDVDRFIASGRTMATVADLPKAVRTNYVRDYKGKRYYAIRTYPKGSIEDPEIMRGFRDFVTTVDPEITGLPITFINWGVLLRDGLERSALIGLCLVFALVLADLRHLGHALLVMVPVALGTVWMVGIMNFIGLQYNFANALGIPLVLGIGVDAGVHLMHRYRQGTSPARLVSTTGKAVTVSSLTSILAIGSLVLADHVGLNSLGLVLVIGISSCLVAAVVVLPALLALRPRA